MIITERRVEATDELPIGQRVALVDSSLKGTVIDYHKSTYGIAGKMKRFFGYKIQWDKASIGICENSDLQILTPIEE